MEVEKSQGGFITSPKANTAQLHSVTGSRRAEGGGGQQEKMRRRDMVEEAASLILTWRCIPLLLWLTRAVTLLGSSRCPTGCASHNGVTC